MYHSALPFYYLPNQPCPHPYGHYLTPSHHHLALGWQQGLLTGIPMSSKNLLQHQQRDLLNRLTWFCHFLPLKTSNGFLILIGSSPVSLAWLYCALQNLVWLPVWPQSSPASSCSVLWLDSVTCHSLGSFATLFLPMPLTLKKSHFLSYFMTQLMSPHRRLVLTLPVRTVRCATNCLWYSVPSWLSKLVLESQRLEVSKLHHPDSLAGRIPVEILQRTGFCVRCEVKRSPEKVKKSREKEKSSFTFRNGRKSHGQMANLVALSYLVFLRGGIGFPLSLLPQISHQFDKYWISCNKSLPLEMWRMVSISLILVFLTFSSEIYLHISST